MNESMRGIRRRRLRGRRVSQPVFPWVIMTALLVAALVIWRLQDRTEPVTDSATVTPAAKTGERARQAYQKGLDMFRSREYGSAVQAFRKALDLGADRTEVAFDLGQAIFLDNPSGNHDAALKFLANLDQTSARVLRELIRLDRDGNRTMLERELLLAEQSGLASNRVVKTIRSKLKRSPPPPRPPQAPPRVAESRTAPRRATPSLGEGEETGDVARADPPVEPPIEENPDPRTPLVPEDEEPRAVDSDAAAYTQTVRTLNEQLGNSGEIHAKVGVVTDAYRYFMALGFEEIRLAGFEGKELTKELRKLHDAHRTHKGKALFLLTLDVKAGPRKTLPGRFGPQTFLPVLDGENYYFLQHGLKKSSKGHVTLTHPRSTKRFNIVKEDPRPSFTSWYVFVKPAGRRQSSYTKKLCRFDHLSFSLVSKINMDDRSPFVLTVGNIIRVKDNSQNPDWTKSSESINLQQKQITIPGWGTQRVDPIRFEFYPRRLKNLAWPEAYNDLLEQAEGKR